MYYILTDNKQELQEITDVLVKNGYVNSNIASFDGAIGIATTPHPSESPFPRFTYLHPSMVCDNPHISWTFNRRECKTREEFEKFLFKENIR
jgi:hypothetical protein